MRVIEATDDLQKSWDAFVASSPMGSFLQSWAWGEVQRAAGFRVTRLVVPAGADSRDMSAACLLVHRPLPFQRGYLSAPWGPVLRGSAGASEDVCRAVGAFTQGLRARLSKRVVFARIEPRAPASAEWDRLLSSQGYRAGSRNIQPKDTLVTDLSKSEDDLLRAMHPKARYNIRVARRRGVRVEEETNFGGLRRFLELVRATERRGKFHYHPDRHYAAMLQVLQPLGMLRILIARHEGMFLAAHFLVRFGDTVTYVHGASSEQRKSVMAPHLLQWEGMLQAKAQGAARYDLFGVAPPHSPVTHPWFGITRFKQGFGGSAEHYAGAADLVGDGALYRAYEIGRGLRALLK